MSRGPEHTNVYGHEETNIYCEVSNANIYRLTQMERKKWRVRRRDGGLFCLLLVVCRCASPGISAQPDDHDRPANPLPTYVPCRDFVRTQPAASSASSTYQDFPEAASYVPGLAREKDTDAAIPREAIASRPLTCPRIFCRIPSHAAFREAPIAPSFPPTLTHRAEILAGAVLRDLG